jgi:hypothetical protein
MKSEITHAPNQRAEPAAVNARRDVSLAPFVRRAKALLGPRLRKPPGFLIIGAQKAGTTSLHHYLGRHPALRPANGPKELHFFDIYHHRGLGWYLSHFPRRFPPDGRICFEATPDYLHRREAAERISRDLGRVRLVVILREPSARAYSAWRMWSRFDTLRPGGSAKADRRSFAQAIAEELAAPDGSADRHYHYVSAGRYAEHLERFRTCFAARDVLVLDYASMNRDLGEFLGRICEFLDIEPFSRDQVAQFDGHRLWTSPPLPEENDPEATLALLRDYYAPWNARLFGLLGERWDW